MQREETKKILRIITVTYPAWKMDITSDTVDTWNMFLEDYSYQEIAMALKAYVTASGSGYAPSVSQLIDYLHKIKEVNDESPMQAWEAVRKAISNSGYHAEEEFNKLPELTQKAIGSPSMLHQWAVSESYNESVIQSNFLKSFSTLQERKKTFARMPIEVQQLISQKALKGGFISDSIGIDSSNNY